VKNIAIYRDISKLSRYIEKVDIFSTIRYDTIYRYQERYIYRVITSGVGLELVGSLDDGYKLAWPDVVGKECCSAYNRTSWCWLKGLVSLARGNQAYSSRLRLRRVSELASVVLSATKV